MLSNFIPGFKTYLGIALSAVGQTLKAMGYGTEAVDEAVNGAGADATSILDNLDVIVTNVMAWGGLVLAAYGRFVARVETLFNVDFDGDGNIGGPK